MLTDYHLHLRSDAVEATASDHFTTENVDRYLRAAADAGIAELGVSEHIYRFTPALEIWDHALWRGLAHDDLDAYCEFVRTTPLRLGIEMDFVPGAEDRIAGLLDAHDFDYVVGSTHFVGDRAVDDGEYDIWDRESDADRVWSSYFRHHAEAARSGLYDILAHPDLVKKWGANRPAPQRDPRFHYEPLVEAVAESGIAVEVSTAGLRRPVEEIYPSDALATMLVEAGAVFALSSDAHRPEEVGQDYDRAMEAMRGWGVGEVAVFDQRLRRMEPLG